MTDIQEIPPRVNPARAKRPMKRKTSSLDTVYPHTTVNGLGVVGRLYWRKGRKNDR